MERRQVRSGSPYEERYGFTRGVRVGDRVEIAGTAPIPAAGDTVAATAFGQMVRCGAIAVAGLEELGATVADVVRTRMFITDPSEADEIGRAHKEVFGDADPVSTMVVVAALLDPQWKVEIEVEAIVTDPAS